MEMTGIVYYTKTNGTWLLSRTYVHIHQKTSVAYSQLKDLISYFFPLLFFYPSTSIYISVS